MIHNLIWDVDGTLFDTYPAFVAAFAEALAGFDVQVDPARILSLVKVSVGHAAEVMADEFHLEAQELKARFWQRYSRQPFAEQPPFPNLVTVCQVICDRGGKNVIVTHRGMETTTGLLREHKLARYFADIVSVASGYARKPDPEMYQVAMDRNRLIPAETMAVGDREIDILAGEAAGVRTCVFQPVELPSAADWVIEDFSELLKILNHN